MLCCPISKELGGLGYDILTYCKTLERIGEEGNSMRTFFSVHTSIGQMVLQAWVEKPIDALSGCRESSLHKDAVPDAVDTNGDGIADSSISDPERGSAPVDTNGDGIADAVDTNGDGIPDSSISEPEPLYQSQRYKCDPNSDTLEINTKGDKVIELQTYFD
jgi:Acyl-CoA dehydrogenase, N-terminal domain